MIKEKLRKIKKRGYFIDNVDEITLNYPILIAISNYIDHDIKLTEELLKNLELLIKNKYIRIIENDMKMPGDFIVIKSEYKNKKYFQLAHIATKHTIITVSTKFMGLYELFFLPENYDILCYFRLEEI